MGPRNNFVEISDNELAQQVSARLVAARNLQYCVADSFMPSPVNEAIRSCAPVATDDIKAGGAMLLGLVPDPFGWSVENFVQAHGSNVDIIKARSYISSEYGVGGLNETFRTIIQGSTTVIGCASARTQRVYKSMGLGVPPIGGAVGSLDCHIGGSSNCCSESSACIRYLPTASGAFQFSALSDKDLIMLNGQRITPLMGSFPLLNEDICTVGPRVFVFLLPNDSALDN